MFAPILHQQADRAAHLASTPVSQAALLAVPTARLLRRGGWKTAPQRLIGGSAGPLSERHGRRLLRRQRWPFSYVPISSARATMCPSIACSSLALVGRPRSGSSVSRA